MIKLILFSILGKKLPYADSLFAIVKTYLIIYLMILPVLLDAQVEQKQIKKPIGNQVYFPELPESRDSIRSHYQLNLQSTFNFEENTLYHKHAVELD